MKECRIDDKMLVPEKGCAALPPVEAEALLEAEAEVAAADKPIGFGPIYSKNQSKCSSWGALFLLKFVTPVAANSWVCRF